MALSFPHLPAQETRTSLPFPETIEERRAARARGRLRAAAERCLALWHLASLDAATVAVVWSAAFAWAAGVRVAAWRLGLQGLAVWTVYVADRLLDARAGLRASDLEPLRERHFFHWRHRRVLAPMAAAAACATAALILTRLPTPDRARSAALAAAALVYFAQVHWFARSPRVERGARRGARPLRAGSFLSRVVTKEMLVGVLFTAGCTLPAMGRMPGAGRGPVLCVVGFFALVAWLNCGWIEEWERETPSRVTRGRAGGEAGWAGGWFPAGAGLALAALLWAHPRAAELLLAGALSAALLAWLDGQRSRMSPVTLRAAADLVLLTPLLVMAVAGLGR